MDGFRWWYGTKGSGKGGGSRDERRTSSGRDRLVVSKYASMRMTREASDGDAARYFQVLASVGSLVRRLKTWGRRLSTVWQAGWLMQGVGDRVRQAGWGRSRDEPCSLWRCRSVGRDGESGSGGRGVKK